MTIKEQLMADLKLAMKEKNALKKSTVTMVRAAILQQEKDNKTTLEDDEVLSIISKQVKQRKDSLEEFKNAQREDLVEQTQKELDILMEYLPRQLNEEEIRQIVNESITEVGATSMKDMGKIMSSVMPKV
ncbi:MAG TPA: aspartyl-tRNA amidotransferase, partial [Eubacteriaceae bacterium]|nr:aspartyl-tRNA amidotransferase [Eubacteriaceae bacterium]